MTSNQFQALIPDRVKICAVVFTLFISASLPAYAVESVGRVLSTIGRVVAVRQSQPIVLKKGSVIQVGDEIVTDPDSYAQIHFSDSSIMSLKPGTVFQVNDYAFSGTEDGSEKAIFSLLRGGMRTVTGLIGHLHHDTYGVITPTATIGIRGTSWAATQCGADECKKADGTFAKEGTYGEVNYGTIAVKNDTPEVDFSSGTAFYVADRKSSPLRITVAPDFVTQGPRKPLQSSATGAAPGDRETLSAESSTGGEVGLGLTASADGSSSGVAAPSSSAQSEVPASTITQSYVASNNTSPSGTAAVLGPVSFKGFVTAYTFYYNLPATTAANNNGTATGPYVYYTGTTPQPYLSDAVSGGFVSSCPNYPSCAGDTAGGNVAPTFRGLQLVGWTGVAPYVSTLNQTASLAGNGQIINLGNAGVAIVEQLKGPYAGNDTGIVFNGSPGSLIYAASSSPLADVSSGAPVFASGSYSFGGPGAFVGLAADSLGNSGRLTALIGTLNATSETVSFAATVAFANLYSAGPATLGLHSSGYLQNFTQEFAAVGANGYTGIAFNTVFPTPNGSIFTSDPPANVNVTCIGVGCRLINAGAAASTSWYVGFIGSSNTGLGGMLISAFIGSAYGQPGPEFALLGVAKCKSGRC